MNIRSLLVACYIFFSGHCFSQALTPQGEMKLPKIQNNFGAGISFEVPVIPSSFLYYPSRITDSTLLYKNAFFSEGFIPQAEFHLFHSRTNFISFNLSYTRNKSEPKNTKTGFAQYESGLQFTHVTRWSFPGFIYPIIGCKIDFRHNLLTETTASFFPNPTYDHSYRNFLTDKSDLVDISVPVGFMLANGNFRFILSTSFELTGFLKGNQSIVRDTYFYETFIQSDYFSEAYSRTLSPMQLASFYLKLIYILHRR